MKNTLFAGLAIAAAAMTTGVTTAQAAVSFVPGTYELSDSYLGTAVDTLVVTVSGGVATFDVTGQDTLNFSIVQGAEPTGYISSENFYFDTSSSAVISTSFPSNYTDITFWSTASSGGLTIGTGPGETSQMYVDLYQSSVGTAQLFAAVPEPSSWALMIVGTALAGAALRRRPRPARVTSVKGTIAAM